MIKPDKTGYNRKERFFLFPAFCDNVLIIW